MQTLLGISQAMSFETARLNEFERAQLAKAAVKAAADIFNADTPGLTPLPAEESTCTVAGEFGEVQIKGKPDAVNAVLDRMSNNRIMMAEIEAINAANLEANRRIGKALIQIQYLENREKTWQDAVNHMHAIVEDYPKR